MSLIPDPPLDDDGDLRISNFHFTQGVCLFRGPASGCVMCQATTWEWFDLTLADMPPVTDRYGTLTDQLPIHGGCGMDLLHHWVSLVFEDSGPAGAPPDAEPGAGVRSTAAPTGRYARSGGTA